MKLFIFLSAFVALAAADNFLSAKLERALVPPQSEVLINGTFEVPQDHFNPTNGRRLKFVRIFNQIPEFVGKRSNCFVDCSLTPPTFASTVKVVHCSSSSMMASVAIPGFVVAWYIQLPPVWVVL